MMYRKSPCTYMYKPHLFFSKVKSKIGGAAFLQKHTRLEFSKVQLIFIKTSQDVTE